MASPPRTGFGRRNSLHAIVAVLLVLGASPCFAQGGNSADLQRKYDAKLQEPFVKAVRWATTLEEAKERARAEKKPILGYFTRSYAP